MICKDRLQGQWCMMLMYVFTIVMSGGLSRRQAHACICITVDHVIDCSALMTVSIPRSSWGRFKGAKDLRLEMHLSKVPTQMQLKHTLL